MTIRQYEDGEFCRHIGCLFLSAHDKRVCGRCMAYRLHDYLIEHGYAIITGTTMVEQRLREQEGGNG